MSTPIEPVVQLFNADTNIEYDNTTNTIEFGVVKAGEESPHINLQLWNNKGGEQEASTMRDVSVIVLDKNDAKLEPIVKEGWLHVKCLSAGDSTFTRLNDTNELALTASGAEPGTIQGGINDGVAANSVLMHATMEIYAQIVENVINATHGEKPFGLAVRYFFT